MKLIDKFLQYRTMLALRRSSKHENIFKNVSDDFKLYSEMCGTFGEQRMRDKINYSLKALHRLVNPTLVEQKCAFLEFTV
jgi:hypothetical protein